MQYFPLKELNDNAYCCISWAEAVSDVKPWLPLLPLNIRSQAHYTEAQSIQSQSYSLHIHP